MSLPEVLLWNLLRKNPAGLHIRRQHSIESFVLDFYCAQTRTAFEIDGSAHDIGDNPVRDEVRTARLSALGIEVVRIAALDVLKSPEDVAEAIVRYCLR